MPSSRDPGQGLSGVDAPLTAALAPVTFLPGAREARAEREAAEAAESAATHAADARRAENVAMHALTRRGQSRAEVAELLRRREIDPIVAEAELDRLESVGLIDDRALAVDLVDRLRSRKKLGDSALRSELMRRKVDRAAIDEALAENADPEAHDDLVFELARDRARRLGGLDRSTAERRLVDFLARKGHSGSAVREAARRALDDRDDELAGDASGPSTRLAAVHRVEFR
ncbi:regulatory protein RecX [Microcella sp.]|uniref:regulatory protein RecX n=1 Tax=Microcella sp. TaxID=1913979 RepID=UPI003F72E600